MSAKITDADRAAAHKLECVPCGYDWRKEHGGVCEAVAQAIADAREEERNACVAWVREAEGDGVADDLAAVRRSR